MRLANHVEGNPPGYLAQRKRDLSTDPLANHDVDPTNIGEQPKKVVEIGVANVEINSTPAL